jgi:tetratricopeptide (TPR) repeat protein
LVALLLLLLGARSAAAADYASATQMFREGKYSESIAAAGELVQQNEYHEPAWMLKIRGELTLGRYADAVKSLDAALAKLTNSVQLRWIGREACRYAQQGERVKKLDEEITALLQRSPWLYSDLTNQLIIGRWMLSQGVDPKQVLTKIYNEAKRRQPSHVDVWLAIGDLALEKHDYKLAGDSYQQAVKLDSTNADAQFGVAEAFAPSDPEKAEQAMLAALDLNSQYTPALLMAANEHIDSEQYDTAEKVLLQVLAINPQQPRALAYRAVIAHLRNKLDQEKQLRAAALKTWAQNPEVDYLIGKKLSQKYRFAEGASYQRESLTLAPNYLAAKIQLAQDLLRLGEVAAGLKLAEEVSAADGFNVLAYNLVTLQENVAKFRTLEDDGIQVRMDAREADIYGPRVLALLKRAKQDLCAKYKVTLDQPVIVEMFPRQQDFAIRTFGMPGGSGFLGVCFGRVITAPSPASQGSSPSCWEATLWHEFCHVVTLTKTKNKMPRWLSEGISVYEEGQENRAWGQAITPSTREMILGDDLTPVSKLSGAFLSPKSGAHLQFAYLESSLVVKYLIEKYGQDMLERVLVDLSVGMPINESLARYTGSLAALDEEFAKYAREQASAMAPEADWSKPELPRGANLEAITAWLKEHPNNYAALQRLAEKQLQAKDWQAAEKTLQQMISLYPHDASGAGAQAMLARVHRETGDLAAERKTLAKLAELSASELEVFARLHDLAMQEQDWKEARHYALRSLAVNPLIPAPHRQAAAAAEKLDDHELTESSYQALLLLDPFDQAELHYRLAKSLQAQKKLPQAKRQVVLALEETPRYQAAQALLLELVKVLPTATVPLPPAEQSDSPGDEPELKPAPPGTSPAPKTSR